MIQKHLVRNFDLKPNLLNYFIMLQATSADNSLSPRKFYIKRKQLREEDLLPNSSIFESSGTKIPLDMSIVQDLKKYQTLTTAIDNTITLHTNNDEAFSTLEKSHQSNHLSFLPKLQLMGEPKQNLRKIDNRSQQLQSRKKVFSYHESDPFYLQLDRNAAKRSYLKFNQYKKRWAESCLRRKEKSLLERSLNKAAKSIETINLDASVRKNTTHLLEMLRNNIAEKTFVFPGKLKPSISGLKGNGGKVVPIFSQVLIAEEMYKLDKRKLQ